jgi:hypothetical protein
VAVGGLVAICIFLIAALLLLLRKSPSLSLLASVLFWPYWLVSALVFEDRWFQGTGLDAMYYFLCLAIPVLLALAAGAVSYRPNVAHLLALAGIVAMPRVYTNVIRGYVLGNVWLTFNEPWAGPIRLSSSDLMYAVLAIVSVTSLVLAILIAGLRFTPEKWRIRGVAICNRSWPAFAFTLMFLLCGSASLSCLTEFLVLWTTLIGQFSRYSTSKNEVCNFMSAV